MWSQVTSLPDFLIDEKIERSLRLGSGQFELVNFYLSLLFFFIFFFFGGGGGGGWGGGGVKGSFIYVYFKIKVTMTYLTWEVCKGYGGVVRPT